MAYSPSTEEAPTPQRAPSHGWLHDLHRDWLHWTRAERVTVAGLGIALLLLAGGCVVNAATGLLQ